MFSLSIEAIAARVQGTVRGDASRLIGGAASLSKAGPGDLTFAVGEKPLRKFKTFSAGGCLISKADAAIADPFPDNTFILVDDPQDAFLLILREFRPQRSRRALGISPAAHISPTAKIGPDCNIYPGATIADGVVIGARCDIHPGVSIGEDCRIGDDCVLYPNVVLYADVVLESRVILHAGCVLGADGFGYRFRTGRFEKIPQLGSVRIEDDCEIGACATIDRGMIGPTVIGAGTKIDNLVMVGHNCELGKHNALASQVGFAGSVTTGDYVRCAGQVGIADHVHLGSNSLYGAKAGVHRDMPGNASYLGAPAIPDAEAFRMLTTLPKVPEMRKQLRELENQVAKLMRVIEQLQTNTNQKVA